VLRETVTLIMPKTAGAGWRNLCGLPRKPQNFSAAMKSNFQSLFVSDKGAFLIRISDLKKLQKGTIPNNTKKEVHDSWQK
jgi:hypothetical protein